MNSTGAKFAALFTSLVVVAFATTLVLPGRQTPQVIKAFFDGLSGSVRAAIGIQ